MIKLSNRGRRANNEEMAALFHSLNLGESINVYGSPKETARLANSLSRTHKAHQKTRLSFRTKSDGSIKITCISDKKPKTVFVI